MEALRRGMGGWEKTLELRLQHVNDDMEPPFCYM